MTSSVGWVERSDTQQAVLQASPIQHLWTSFLLFTLDS